MLHAHESHHRSRVIGVPKVNGAADRNGNHHLAENSSRSDADTDGAAAKVEDVVRELRQFAREQGFLTRADVADMASEGLFTAAQMDEIQSRLRLLEIEITEPPEVETETDSETKPTLQSSELVWKKMP